MNLERSSRTREHGLRRTRTVATGMCLILLVSVSLGSRAAEPSSTPTNRTERLEWFRDVGFGMFIHWSADSQLGSVNSGEFVVTGSQA